jgi:hypothetical protein
MQCDGCETVTEVRCQFSQRETRECGECGLLLTPLFSLNANFYIPESFRHTYSETTGYTSEKELLKAHPNLVPSRELDNVESARDKMEREGREADAKVADIEHALMAQGKMKKPKSNGKAIKVAG